MSLPSYHFHAAGLLASVILTPKQSCPPAVPQTGSGKTAAFCFPIIASMLLSNYQPVARGSRKATPFALILAPTRELTSQVRTIVWEQVWIAKGITTFRGFASSGKGAGGGDRPEALCLDDGRA